MTIQRTLAGEFVGVENTPHVTEISEVREGVVVAVPVCETAHARDRFEITLLGHLKNATRKELLEILQEQWPSTDELAGLIVRNMPEHDLEFRVEEYQ